MKALSMTMVKKFDTNTLAGGLGRQPLTPEDIKRLNKTKREELKAQKELRDWRRFGEKTHKESIQKAKQERANKLGSIAVKFLQSKASAQ